MKIELYLKSGNKIHITTLEEEEIILKSDIEEIVNRLNKCDTNEEEYLITNVFNNIDNLIDFISENNNGLNMNDILWDAILSGDSKDFVSRIEHQQLYGFADNEYILVNPCESDRYIIVREI